MKIALLALVCALVPQLGFADAFSIQVLSTQYTTTITTINHERNVDTTPYTYTTVTVTNTRTSADPLTDTVTYQGVQIGEAFTDLFSVRTHTTTAGTDLTYTDGAVIAEATSLLTFQPLADGTAPIGLAFAGRIEAMYSSGAASLTDLTADTLLWSYYWDPFFHGTVPWVQNVNDATLPRFTATLSPETMFQADHQYSLSLFASSIANGDAQLITIDASGLEPTPEPASLLLIGVGLAGAGLRRLRR